MCDCNRALPTWLTWQGLRRLYNYHVTRNILTVVHRHRDVLFSPLTNEGEDSSCNDGVLAAQPDMGRTLSATSVTEIDTHLQRYSLNALVVGTHYSETEGNLGIKLDKQMNN